MAVNCEYCGQLIETGARYCAYCGAPAPAETAVTQSAVSGQDATIVSGSGNYSVILVSLGTCARAAAADLLEDTLGYSDTESSDLFSMLPAQIAQMLTYQQASYLAQAMTEYGMEVSVSNGSEYVTVDETAETQSVFDTAGSFVGKVLSVLGTITGLNRMRKFRKLNDQRYYARPYRPKTYQPAPPVHVRRNVRTAPQPKPVQEKRQNAPSMHQPQRPASSAGMHSAPQQNHPGGSQMSGPGGRGDDRPAGGARREGGNRGPQRH